MVTSKTSLNITWLPSNIQIKYSFWPYQKTPEQIEAKRKEFNDPKWRPSPLAVVNVSVPELS